MSKNTTFQTSINSGSDSIGNGSQLFLGSGIVPSNNVINVITFGDYLIRF
jgi:hypothetical protein